MGGVKSGLSERAAGVRLDKWLWAARFYKTRALAAEAIDKGQVLAGGQPVKRSREVRIGERYALRIGGPGLPPREIEVLQLGSQRGPAPTAQQLYAETAPSLAAREAAARARKLAPEPALAIAHGRPTKRDRRELQDWQRWSVSLSDES
jgi:ribosome-associated heat shock protein Hsp15